MMKKTILFLLTITFVLQSIAQNKSLTILPNIHLPKDSVMAAQLVTSLNSFLDLKDEPAANNSFILKEDLLETTAMLDEMKDISKSERRKNNNFYNCFLTNIMKKKDSVFLIQISFIGVDDSVPYLRASFSFWAKLRNKHFFFCAPLKQNTETWKTYQFENTTIHFSKAINTANAQHYLKMAAAYDKKLSAPSIHTEYYACEDLYEVFRLIGVDYKSDFNGFRTSSTSAKTDSTFLYINGTFGTDFKDIDPHDLWHSRLHRVLSPTIINRPVDEGTAYLYGGSWGLSWQEIVTKFKTFVATNPNADWLQWYNESKNFEDTAKFPLNVDFMINALLAQRLEKEKGFDAVMQLLQCGPKEKDNANYFKKLTELTGITQANFNKKIGEMIMKMK